VAASGITYNLEFEVTRAAIRMGLPPSSFRAWPVDDQCRVMAALRLEARIDAVLAAQARQQARRKRG
jgi:hypothetical protein